MDKESLASGMLIKISAGTGTYAGGKKWSGIIRVISVNRFNGKVSGIQYKTLAQRGGDKHPHTHFKYTDSKVIQNQKDRFDEWWKIFNAKILV